MTLPLIFSCTVIFIIRFTNKILLTFLPQFFLPGCYENVTTFHFGLPASAKFSPDNFASIRLCGFCNEIIMTFHFCFLTSAKFFSAILPQFAYTGCNEIVTTFMIEKSAFPRHGTAMFWEVGVIKLTAIGVSSRQ
jgi:hypothetical protein